MQKDIQFYENEILNGIRKIERYIGNMDFQAFSNDEKTFDACCMQLQHIGECGLKLGKLTNNNYKDLPFVDMKGFRNKITHDYAGMDERIIWDTIKNSLPELRTHLLTPE